jgi:hypothetical protein
MFRVVIPARRARTSMVIAFVAVPSARVLPVGV